VESLTDVIIDTVALVHHLADSLPDKAAHLFSSAENGHSTLLLPEVALGEFVYLALKGKLGFARPRALVDEVVAVIRGSGYIQTCGLNGRAWKLFLDLPIPELHDRMIASTALARELSLVSNDTVFARVPSLDTIWA
jgi:predicted nucleic acid-binding protein